MASVKVSWSGGKDSTAAVLLHVERGDKVTAVCYIPMFNDVIPLIGKDHYDFLHRAAAELGAMGVDVRFVHGMTYWDFVTYITTRGKNKGKIFGFPCYMTGKCNFRLYSKGKALDSVPLDEFDYEDFGLAADETARHGQLSKFRRSILLEEGYTEEDAKHICSKYGLLSPLYFKGIKRDGCALCPHADAARREGWFSDFPEAVPLVLQLQQMVLQQRPDRLPMRGGRLFLED